MKTDIEIKDIFFNIIEDSALHKAVTGGLYRDQRPTVSASEDVVISIADGENGAIQSAIVDVAIYVADVARGEDRVENTPRLRELSRLACQLLEEHIAGDIRFQIKSQRCLKVEGVDQHCINNRIFLEITNFKYNE